MISISLNNTPTEIALNTSLKDAVQQWGYGESKIAVAINGEFIARNAYAERSLQSGDEVDIVKPVGGG